MANKLADALGDAISVNFHGDNANGNSYAVPVDGSTVLTVVVFRSLTAPRSFLRA